MVTDGKCTCGEPSVIHREVKSPEMNVTLCVDYIQLKKILIKKLTLNIIYK